MKIRFVGNIELPGGFVIEAETPEDVAILRMFAYDRRKIRIGNSGGNIADNRYSLLILHDDKVAIDDPVKTMTIQIGNSDNKLSQNEWAHYVHAIKSAIEKCATRVHFFGGSNTFDPWQNVAWVIEIGSDKIDNLRRRLTMIRTGFEQESVAIAIYDQGFC